ncbi:MAG: hypothetical protein WAU91_22725 [Desulfatitalea sp.]
MLNEFSHKGKTYCIKTPMDSDYSKDEAIKFNRLQDVQSFFKAALNDSGAWTVIMSIAKWNYPFSCRPPKRCPEPGDQEFFDTFCQQIFTGELILIEMKPGATSSVDNINDLKLLPCCIIEIQKINGILTCGNILTGVIIGLPVFNAFFYPPGYNHWASLASTVVSIRNEDWVGLVERVKIVPQMARQSAREVAQYHCILHEKNKSVREIILFWRGVADALV